MKKSRNEEILSQTEKEEPILSGALRKFAEDVQTGEIKGRQWITLVNCMNDAADQLDKYVKLAEKRRVK